MGVARDSKHPPQLGQALIRNEIRVAGGRQKYQVVQEFGDPRYLRNKKSQLESNAMKAVRMFQVNQPLEMREIPTPAVGMKDVLVRIKAAGICRSDVHYLDGISPVRPLPMTLGHEIAGEIAAVGENVSMVIV